MKVKCISNTGKILLPYERKPLNTSEYTTYGQLSIGEEYFVMGMILKGGYLSYLIDSAKVISTCPSQLFEMVDHSLPSHWHFKSYTKNFKDYINKEAIGGYSEFVFDELHYTDLLEMTEEAHSIYFKRKLELHKI